VSVKAVFVELPPFERHRADYFDDEALLRLQRLLMLNPEAGDVIPVQVDCVSYVLRINDAGKVNGVVCG
jgi:hypothetical protein